MSAGAGWAAVLPVKPWALSKSRLDVAPELRVEIARAMALDVLDVLVLSEAVERVVVVTAEPEMAALTRRVGGHVVSDRPLLWGDEPTQSVRTAAVWAQSRFPGLSVVAVPADLATLTPAVLDATLASCAGRHHAFVPDARGSGTTIITTGHAPSFDPTFGSGSCLAHSKAGMRAMPEADPRARLDVNTLEDLVAAERLGPGLRLKRVLQQLAA